MAAIACVWPGWIWFEAEYVALVLEPKGGRPSMENYSTMPYSCGHRRSGCGVGGTLAKLIRRPHGGASVMVTNGFTNAQIASGVFTIGTVAVLPFYTLMVLAPKAKLQHFLTRSLKSRQGNCRQYDSVRRSWPSLCISPVPVMDARDLKDDVCESILLPGIAKMFSNEMTLASAWIHLLVVDLFAARQIFQDGLVNDVETRHSVSLCLLFCPIGILSHVVTKSFSKRVVNTEQSIH
ncbi:hypothetical protein Sjap_024487 [Stephania japonica]|uniref:Uncharacterized protein n=1 Tax=Stephania japonica TaxID=461633 RepID=A0AAP0EFM3_9MAGN